MKNLKNRIFLIIRFIVCIALALALYYIFEPMSIKNTGNRAEDSQNWMARIPDDTLISEVYIPGTHDSGTRYADLRYFSQCQASVISTQLKDGYRYLDIRLGLVESKSGDQSLAFFHGFCRCKNGLFPWAASLTFEDAINDSLKFLDSNPTETVIFAVKMEQGEDVEAFQKLLHQYIEKYPDRWYLGNTIPRMAECRGKIVLFRRYEDACGYGNKSGIQLFWEDQGNKNNSSLSAALEQQDTYKLMVQDRYKYSVKDKWQAFLDGLEKSTKESADLSINFLSTNPGFLMVPYSHPYTFAKTLNKNFQSEDLSKYSPAWMILDFGNPLMAYQVYELNFK